MILPWGWVDLQSGVLRFLRNGNHSAPFITAQNTMIQFGYPGKIQTINPGVAFLGQGIVQITGGGTMDFVEAEVITWANFRIGGPSFLNIDNSGYIKGGGVLTSYGNFLWNYGDIDGIEVINEGFFDINVDVGGLVHLDSAIMRNNRFLTWLRGDIWMGNFYFPPKGAQIINKGTFTIQCNDQIKIIPEEANIINEPEGIIQKTGPVGSNIIEVNFFNNGNLYLFGREMEFQNSFEQTGGKIWVGNGTLTVTNNFLLQSGELDLGYNGQGRLIVPNGLVIGAPAFLKGVGTIHGNVSNNGTIEVRPFDPGTSLLQIQGDYQQTGCGTLLLWLKSSNLLQYGRVEITGKATLSGNLTINPLPGFDPGFGEEFPILTFAEREGDFDNKTFPPLGEGKTWRYDLGETFIMLIVVIVE